MVIIIPARGGSTRIPNKATMEFEGFPMIVHTIARAKRVFPEFPVYVTSDDDKIRQVAMDHGAIPLERESPENSNRTTSMFIPCAAAVRRLGMAGHAKVLILWACAPTLRDKWLRGGHKMSQSLPNSSVFAAVESRYPSRNVMVQSKHGLSFKYAEDGARWGVQDSSTEVKEYYNAGLFAFVPRNHLLVYETIYHECAPYQVPRWDTIDIDTEDDLKEAKLILRNRKDD